MMRYMRFDVIARTFTKSLNILGKMVIILKNIQLRPKKHVLRKGCNKAKNNCNLIACALVQDVQDEHLAIIKTSNALSQLQIFTAVRLTIRAPDNIEYLNAF